MQLNLPEAERRISEARRIRAESLDLGDLELSELPASLGNLTHLKALYLSTVRLTELGVLVWHRNREASLVDLGPLAGIQGLQSLSLSRCKGVSNVAPLAALQELKNLDLSHTSVADLAPLAKLQRLQNLNLSLTGVRYVDPLARLQELQNLDLSNTSLVDLTPLAKLHDLQSLNLSGTNVTDLTPLAGLQKLRRLSLFETDVTDLSALAELHGLQELTLSRTGVMDLAPLANLQGLQNLSLCQMDIADLAPLADLHGLRELYVWDTDVTDLSPLSGLQGLQNLNLGDTGVTDPSPLSGLQGLQNLYLWSTGVKDLSPLSGLQGLQNLYLSSTGVSDLSPLSGLQGLQSLDLSSTGVTDLSPLSGLQGLQSLDLSSTGVTDLSPLSGLQGLRSLDLASSDVTDLSPLSGLQGLRSLDLASTSVTDLSPLFGLQGLQSLDLASTGVADLSPVASLEGLQSLYLDGCRPAIPAMILQAFADHPRLTQLVADEAVGVPREVLSHGYSDNCLARLRTYFSELDLGVEAENEVKVILLGNGCVGKTQLCRRFRGQSFDESVKSTHGVEIWREELRIRAGGQEQMFQVNWWDFGGQDIYHGTHALFLRSRAVFLVLWTPKLENRDEYSEGEITLRNQPLAYWLDYVRSLAGEGSPVIVVQSQCDRFADRRPDPQRPDGLGFFECCSYSAKEDLGREALEAQLRDALRYLLERNGALEIGHGRAEVRRRLYDWRSEDQERQPEKRQHRTLTLEEFRSICDEAGGIVSWEHALDYFHHTGVVFHRPDLFSNRIVLDQDWALTAIYTVFHRGRAVPLLRDSGQFTREDLAVIVWQDYSLEEQRLFLGLMESCGVCFPCGRTAKGEVRYIAPDLLPKFEAVADRLHAWKDEPGTPTLRLEYRFFHPAIIRNLMSEIGRQAGDLAEYWKYGLWFKDGQRNTQLLVQFQDTSTAATPGVGALELKAQGRDPQGLLREIRSAVLWQRIGEEPEELLTLDGTTVAKSALANAIDGCVLDLQKQLVSATAFATFFEDRERQPDELRAAGETPKIDINPRPLTADEKKPEVFISYAWGDEAPAGKIRAKAVEGLYSALEKDGFLPVRDRDRIRPGERISAFIRRLTSADLVVAVISDKYLRSSYCMYEIYKLWQKSQTEADNMAERLVPIVLPEVKIGDFLERVPYLKYWADRAKSLKALIHDPDLSPSSESWEEFRLVQEFAHHVDGILVFLQDILMPRKLEFHLDDDFQAVRDALRRRMGLGEQGGA